MTKKKSAPRSPGSKKKNATAKAAPSKPPKGRYWTRGKSAIHRHGLFAACPIPEGTRVIEYKGVKLTKAQGFKRATEWMDKAEGTDKGAVYVFELNSRYDIDGNVPWNTARLINHSCSPNCEIDIIRGHIWIIALRDIAEGEEISYDYGYDLDHWNEHPCRCGKESCAGFIVAAQHRGTLRRLLAGQAAAKKKARKK